MACPVLRATQRCRSKEGRGRAAESEPWYGVTEGRAAVVTGERPNLASAYGAACGREAFGCCREERQGRSREAEPRGFERLSRDAHRRAAAGGSEASSAGAGRGRGSASGAKREDSAAEGARGRKRLRSGDPQALPGRRLLAGAGDGDAGALRGRRGEAHPGQPGAAHERPPG